MSRAVLRMDQIRPGDRIVRPHFTEQTPLVVESRPRTPRARKYWTLVYEDGGSWSSERDYPIVRL
jgi:hypothetical protein